MLLVSILNSSPIALISELSGRLYGRGLLKIQTYETQMLPVLNPKSLTEKERRQIENAFLGLVEAQLRCDERARKETKNNLDNAIFDVLGLSETERKQVYDGLKSLREMRLQRKKVEMLVETPREMEASREAQEKRKSR